MNSALTIPVGTASVPQPMSIMSEVMNRPSPVLGVMSPNPTVVMVEIAQYTDTGMLVNPLAGHEQRGPGRQHGHQIKQPPGPGVGFEDDGVGPQPPATEGTTQISGLGRQRVHGGLTPSKRRGFSRGSFFAFILPLFVAPSRRRDDTAARASVPCKTAPARDGSMPCSLRSAGNPHLSLNLGPMNIYRPIGVIDVTKLKSEWIYIVQIMCRISSSDL